jgi:hypothetical protein
MISLAADAHRLTQTRFRSRLRRGRHRFFCSVDLTEKKPASLREKSFISRRLIHTKKSDRIYMICRIYYGFGFSVAASNRNTKTQNFT